MSKFQHTVSRIAGASQFFKKLPIHTLLIVVLLVMFPLGYFESLRWPLPPPKATHGILKGLFLFAAFLVFVFHPKKSVVSRNRSEFMVNVLFLLSFVISAVFSLVPNTSLLFLWYPLIGALYVYAFRFIKFKDNYIDIVIGISAMLIFVTFMFAVFSIFSRYEIDNVYYFLFLDHRANYFLDEIRRAGKYVSLGPYIMLVPLVSVYLVRAGSPVIRKLLSVLVVCVSMLTAVISNNRIDVLVLAIQIAVIMWFIPRRMAVILLILAIPITQFGLSITQRYFGFSLEERILRPHYERDLETIDMRYTYWQTAFYNFREHPLFGTGPNSYNEVSDFPLRRYYDRGASQYTVRPDEGIGIHNIFIERLADTGLFGFLSFIAVLLFYGKKDVLTLLKKRREDRARYALFALSSWSWILYGITDNGYGAQGFVTFFFLRGMIQHI